MTDYIICSVITVNGWFWLYFVMALCGIFNAVPE